MRIVSVQRPSFPTVATEALLVPQAGPIWQVLCGDEEHWRAGLYSPKGDFRVRGAGARASHLPRTLFAAVRPLDLGFCRTRRAGAKA